MRSLSLFANIHPWIIRSTLAPLVHSLALVSIYPLPRFIWPLLPTSSASRLTLLSRSSLSPPTPAALKACNLHLETFQPRRRSRPSGLLGPVSITFWVPGRGSRLTLPPDMLYPHLRFSRKHNSRLINMSATSLPSLLEPGSGHLAACWQWVVLGESTLLACVLFPGAFHLFPGPSTSPSASPLAT